MRWILCCLMLPLSAHASSVLLIPVDEKARVLADDLVEPFGANKLIVKMAGPGSPALNCLKDADRDGCLRAIGEKAKVEAVFVVSGAMKGAKGNLTIEMLSKGAEMKKQTIKVTKGKVKAQMRGPIAALLKLLPKSDASAPVETPKVTVTETPKEPEPVVEPRQKDPEPAKVVDVPKKTEPVVLTPTPPKTEPLVLTTPAPKQSKPKVAAWVVTGLAVVAAGTAATFGGLGLAGKGQLEKVTAGQSGLSYTQATALQQTTNTQLTVALGTGIGAGVGAVVAGILWGVE